MKKILIILVFVTFSLSLAAVPSDGDEEMSERKGNYLFQQLDFRFSEAIIDSIYNLLPVEGQSQIPPEEFQEKFSRFVPCILSLHNSSGEEVSIKEIQEELLCNLQAIGLEEVFSEGTAVQDRIDTSTRKQARFRRRGGRLIGVGSVFVAIGVVFLIPVTALGAGLGVGGLANFLRMKRERKDVELHRAVLRQFEEQLESLMELLKGQIPGLPEGVAFLFSREVSSIETGEEKDFLIFCPEERLEEIQQGLNGILGSHGFFPQEDRL